ncbi:pseudouridine synthase [Novosphingobium sp. JCM 18896]|uniref:pseudouridine synthase n=1 Tax=Novosphingobium sp. JCM 18896 TaxID=2989731 RepID=UPI0022225961|nr:pseudouridine synthase [Novosphingobium sp. JCM 18896]MCW1430068.1 pseudouridine synthase [Novosphingobium sp. JCM 18896]
MSPTPTPPESAGARTGERIAKLLARAGVASRREVERMIAEGRVKLGEEVLTTANTVLPNLKGVTVDGKPVKAAEPARLFVFHKPAGLITAERDPAGRPTIYTALRNALPENAPRLMPVGRLDFNTEGLLLLTNDGELKRAMELPATGIPRTYRARTFGAITQDQLESLIEGIEIDGVRYGKIDANMERSAGRNQWIELTLTEGKNREVRRVLEHFGLEVSRLLRTSYGPFELLDLPRGAAVEIRQVDVERFRKSIGTPGTSAMEPLTAHDYARARVRGIAPTPRAREPERRLSEAPRKPAAKKPLPRKPDPEKLGLETSRPGGRSNRQGLGRPGQGRNAGDTGDSAARPAPRRDAPRRDGPRRDGASKPGPRSSGPRNSGPRKPGGPRK